MRTTLRQRLSHTPPGWAGLFLLTFILGQLYVLLEWVFTVTKPSYLDVFAWGDKLVVLLPSGALATMLSLLGLERSAGRAVGRAAPLAAACLLAGEPAACRAVGGAVHWTAGLE